MPEDPVQQQDNVPLKLGDKYYLVPKGPVADGFMKRGAQKATDEEFQNFLSTPRQKPQYPIPGPAGTQTLSSRGAGTPPPAGPLAATPEGRSMSAMSPSGMRTAMQQEQLQSGAAGINRAVGEFGAGYVKGAGRTAAGVADVFAQAAGLPGTLKETPALQPKSETEAFGGEMENLTEFLIPFGGEAKVDAMALNAARKYVPMLARSSGVPAKILGRTIYNALTGGAVSAVQGRDPATGALISGGLTPILEGLAALRPEILRRAFGVSAHRGTEQEVAAKMSEIGALTRGGFRNKSRKLYESISNSIDTASANLSRGGAVANTNIAGMVSDLEQAYLSASEKDKPAIMKLLDEVHNSVGAIAPTNLSRNLNRSRTLIGDIRKRAEEYMSLPAGDAKNAVAIAISEQMRKLTTLADAIKNYKFEMKPIQINNLRKHLSEYVSWGTAESQLTEAQKVARRMYDRVAGEQSRIMPHVAGDIRQENAVHDIWSATSKPISASFGIHRLRDPGALPEVLGGFLGFQYGREKAGIGGGLLGAYLGSAAVPPAIAAVTKGLTSPVSGALGIGGSQLLFNPSKAEEDWATKGRRKLYQDTTE